MMLERNINLRGCRQHGVLRHSSICRVSRLAELKGVSKPDTLSAPARIRLNVGLLAHQNPTQDLGPKDAAQDATASSPSSEAFSSRTWSSRKKILSVVTANAVGPEVECQVTEAPDLAAALILLLQTGQHEQAIELGEAFLRSAKEVPTTRDVATVVAYAHAALAQQHGLTPSIGSDELSFEKGMHDAYSHAVAALSTVKKWRLPVPAPTMATWTQLEQVLKPLAGLELLRLHQASGTSPDAGAAPPASHASPTTTTSTSSSGAASTSGSGHGGHSAQQRAAGLTMLKAAMWAQESALQRVEIVSQARPLLTAHELITLYEGAPAPAINAKPAAAPQQQRSSAPTRNGTAAPPPPADNPSPAPPSAQQAAAAQVLEQELYDLAMAHIADGFARRWPQSIWRGEELLGMVVERGVGVDVSLESSVCALLLGRRPLTAATAASTAASMASFPVSASSSIDGGMADGMAGGGSGGQGVLELGADGGAQLLLEPPGSGSNPDALFNMWAENWLASSVMRSFQGSPAEVSLDAWFRDPRVVVTNQMGQVGQLGQMGVGAAVAAVGQLAEGFNELVGKGSTQQQQQQGQQGQKSAHATPSPSPPPTGSLSNFDEAASAAALEAAAAALAADALPSFTRGPGHTPITPTEAAQAILNSGTSVDDMPVASDPLWVRDEQGHIRPRMRARIVEGPLPLGVTPWPPPKSRWWLAVSISSNAMWGIVAFALAVANRHKIADVAARIGWLPAMPQSHATLLTHEPAELSRVVQRAQHAAGGAYLTQSGAEALVRCYQVLRAAAAGPTHDTAARTLPQLLCGKALGTVRREADALRKARKALSITHGHVLVTEVTSGPKGQSAVVRAIVSEQGRSQQASKAGPELYSASCSLELQVQLVKVPGGSEVWKITAVSTYELEDTEYV